MNVARRCCGAVAVVALWVSATGWSGYEISLKAQATITLKFFDWAYKNGDKTAGDLDYVPMPDKVKGTIATAWGEIKDASGKPIPFK